MRRTVAFRAAPPTPEDLLREREEAHRDRQPGARSSRHLVEALDIEDVLEHRIRDRVYKARTSVELPRLMAIMEVALECGALRKRQGRYWTVKSWFQAYDKDVVAKAVGWTDMALDFGLAGLRHLWGQEHDPVLDCVQEVELHPLAPPYFADGPVPRREVLDALTANYDNYIEKTSQRPDPSAKYRLGWLLDDVVWTAQMCGVVEAVGAGHPEDPVAAHSWTLTTMRPTALGLQRGRQAPGGQRELRDRLTALGAETRR